METIQEARDFIKDNIDKGVNCPCCCRFNKAYKRSLTSSMALALCQIHRTTSDFIQVEKFFHGQSLFPSSLRGDFAKLRHWGLIEPKQEESDTSQRQNGMYRITAKGMLFCLNLEKVPTYVVLLNDKVQGFSLAETDCRKAFGKKFNYDELMAQ